MNATGMTSNMSSPFTLDLQIGLSMYAAMLFMSSFIGNVVVIYIVCTRSHMKNATNILIANMAVADLLLTIALPYVVKWFYVLDSWFGDNIFEEFLCKFFHSAQIGSITSSVLTLVAISFDRCFAITYPLRKVFSGKILKGTIAVIWLAALGFSIPMIIVTQTRLTPHGSVCNEYWNDFTSMKQEYFIIVFSVCTYFIPLIIIAVVYLITGIRLWQRKLPGNENLLAQEKVHAISKKATLMLITVVLVFALCWLPLQIREVLKFYETPFNIPTKVDIVLPWIGFTNIALNPCLYVIFSENYRSEFLSILCCHESQNLSVYQGLHSIPGSNRGTPIMSRRMTEDLRLSPYISRHTPSNQSMQLKPMQK